MNERHYALIGAVASTGIALTGCAGTEHDVFIMPGTEIEKLANGQKLTVKPNFRIAAGGEAVSTVKTIFKSVLKDEPGENTVRNITVVAADLSERSGQTWLSDSGNLVYYASGEPGTIYVDVAQLLKYKVNSHEISDPEWQKVIWNIIPHEIFHADTAKEAQWTTTKTILKSKPLWGFNYTDSLTGEIEPAIEEMSADVYAQRHTLKEFYDPGFTSYQRPRRLLNGIFSWHPEIEKKFFDSHQKGDLVTAVSTLRGIDPASITDGDIAFITNLAHQAGIAVLKDNPNQDDDNKIMDLVRENNKYFGKTLPDKLGEADPLNLKDLRHAKRLLDIRENIIPIVSNRHLAYRMTDFLDSEYDNFYQALIWNRRQTEILKRLFRDRLYLRPDDWDFLVQLKKGQEIIAKNLELINQTRQILSDSTRIL